MTVLKQSPFWNQLVKISPFMNTFLINQFLYIYLYKDIDIYNISIDYRIGFAIRTWIEEIFRIHTLTPIIHPPTLSSVIYILVCWHTKCDVNYIWIVFRHFLNRKCGWLCSLSGDCWHFWHFREQLLHLGAQLLADEEHVQPVVGKLDFFVFDFEISNSAVLIQRVSRHIYFLLLSVIVFVAEAYFMLIIRWCWPCLTTPSLCSQFWTTAWQAFSIGPSQRPARCEYRTISKLFCKTETNNYIFDP